MRNNIRRIWYVIFSLLLIASATGAMAAKLTLSCNVVSATANSVRSFEAVWQDDDGWWPSSVSTLGIYREDINNLLFNDPPIIGFVWLTGVGPRPIPMYPVEGNPRDGLVFRVTVTAGLNMSNPQQQPQTYLGVTDDMDILTYFPSIDNNMIWDDDGLPVWYAANLRGANLPPNDVDAHAIAWLMPETPDEPPTEPLLPELIDSGPLKVYIYGSRTQRVFPAREMIDYGGGGDADWLTCYPDGWGAGFPASADVDPVTVQPLTEINATRPDDGSSSHEFVFRVRYNNLHNLPPLPWHPYTEMYNPFWGSLNSTSGVVLYLDVNGTGDYRIYPMQPENAVDAEANPDGQVYYYHFLPHHRVGLEGPFWPSKYGCYATDDEDTYRALCMGVYHYFFGCSDDHLRFRHGTWVFMNQPDRVAWGESPVFNELTGNRVSTGLDPNIERTIPNLERPAHRRYSTDGFTNFDYTIYVDRPVRVPSFFESNAVHGIYPYPSSEHPLVTCELMMPHVDDLMVEMDDEKYGYARFYGTLLPYRRAVNPRLPGAFTRTNLALRAESAGCTTATENTFRIFYRQIDGKAPLYVRLKVNNASERSGNTQDHVYKEYTMYPDPTQAKPYNYKTGIWYIYKSKLPAGPHTYYFEAHDGIQKVIWPRRPDLIVVKPKDDLMGTLTDWWVPTNSEPSARGTTDYDNNDFVPGPYVNYPCVLSDQSVTPASGTQTQNFRFRVKYSDPDGQKPYAVYLYIETSNDGKIRRVEMQPEIALDPTQNNSDQWKQGVYYAFDTASMEDLALEKGIRRYRFEFVDDWGRQTDLNDRVKGESTFLPSGGNWIQGPTITQNYAPTLTLGNVESIDGTSNSATLWTFKVTYSDANNHPPAIIKAFIGKLQLDGSTIVWDNGYDMLPSNAGDTVFSDGAEYYYQTRLQGPESSEEPNVTYYYAYVAYDGYQWAMYDSTTSDASSLVMGQVAQKNSVTSFTITPPVSGAPIVGPMDIPATAIRSALTDALVKVNDAPVRWDGTPSGWSAPGDERYSVMYGAAVDADDKPSVNTVVPRFASRVASIEGIYLDPELAGTNYYNPAVGHFRVSDELVTLTTPLDASDAGKTVYIKYHDTAFTVTQRGTVAYGLSQDASLSYVLPEFPGDVKTNAALFPFEAILGVWLNQDCSGQNYIDPYDPALVVTPDPANPPAFYFNTTTPLPAGTGNAYLRYYQLGEYHLDRWNGVLEFLNALNPADNVKVDYMFGRPIPQTLQANTPPTLSLMKNKKGENISLAPVIGTNTTNFVYTVTYKDTDGPNGQAPAYVRVVIDGTAYDMQPASTGIPTYGEGAVYTYTPSLALAGGSHEYYFLASDGASIVILDETGVHDTTNNRLMEVFGFDGPYVNTPPELTNGLASPNPAGGQITPSDSVNYSVVYTDIDGESPYEYNPLTDKAADGTPLGANISESPRVWVDAAVGEDALDKKLYKITRLLSDPFEPGKVRVIEAANEDGTSPNWAIGVHDGKLIQIADGVQRYRVYLVQSNTANTLSIATDGLSTADLVDRGVTRFRINGLVMTKADPSQQDNKLGITYTIAVPKLAKGDHKFHFTARSREDKPQWVKDYIVSQGKTTLPYSIPVRYPATGSVTGPNVVINPPSNNIAPTLSNQEDTPLFIGPKLQIARIVSPSTVTYTDLTKWSNMRGVKGVYFNANEAYLASDQGTNYYETLDDTEFSGDTITLTQNLPAIRIQDEFVQLGTVSARDTGTSLLAVTPDVGNVIASVVGVYVDAALTGTNYYKNGVSTFDGTKITLSKPLPRGTKSVYIKYKWTGGSTKPPVYVEYFAKQADVYCQSDPLTFRISYADTDNDPPSYHDNVQGYVKLVFDNDTTGQRLLPVNSPVTDFTVPVPFTVTPTVLPAGAHKYHFEGSDGYFTTRYPVGLAGNPLANDYSITFNAKPVLSGGAVDPTGGMLSTFFKFKVIYKDADGDGKITSPTVWLRLIKRHSDPNADYSEDDERVYLMERSSTNPTNATYANGIEYSASVSGLGLGTYDVIFEADDSYQDATPYPAEANPIRISVRDDDQAPEIVDYSVTPLAGMSTRLFTYRAWYRDPDVYGDILGDPPVAYLKDQPVEGLTLLVDEDTSKEQTFIMTRAGQGTPDYTVPGGVEYRVDVSGKKLGPGEHTFKIRGYDGTLYANVVEVAGLPVINIPIFTDLRVVDKAAAFDGTGKPIYSAPAITRVAVGQQVIIRGTMKFPYHSSNTVPTSINKIVIQITKPGGYVISLPASVSNITKDADGKYWSGYLDVSYPVLGDSALVTGNSLTMSDSGEWIIRAQWAGDSTTWDKAATDDNSTGINAPAEVTVGGPARAIAVEDPTKPEDSTPSLDMITIPMIIGSTDIGRVFGYDRAMQMQIARWNPASETYFVYGTQGLFPALKPGEAMWIKPKTRYPAGVAIAAGDVESGMLTFANADARTLDPTFEKEYRLIAPLVKAYPTTIVGGQARYNNCEILLRTGWNQFGNIFFNWKTTAQGKQDIGIPISEFKVRYLGQELTLAEAKVAGWIRDYAWRYDADRGEYVLVHPTMDGAERTVRAWYGYWIKALVDCQLIINPNTSYTGEVTGLAGVRSVNTAAKSLDAPPTLPD